MRMHTGIMALGLLLAGGGAAEAQTAARVEYRDGRVGVAVAIGDLPFRVRVDDPRRDHVRSRYVVDRGELRWLVGKDGVKSLDRHARRLGLRGPMEGRWYRTGRRSAVLEVTVRGAPVADLVDVDGDGEVDRFLLVGVRRTRW